MNDAVVVAKLSKKFPDGLWSQREVLKNVQFRIAGGEVTGFVGSNGSGKTTTIKCLLQFIFPDTKSNAQIDFFGEGPLTLKAKARIGYLPERPYLPDHLTALEFLKLHWDIGQNGLNKSTSFEQRAQQVLSQVDLWAARGRRLRNFSKGMLQRAGLAQAILHNPDLLILDEPMSGLDPDGRLMVKQIIRQEKERGATVFFSSHLLADMDELCSALVVINKGEIVFSGAVAEFLKSGITLHRNIEEAFESRISGRLNR